MTIVMHQSEDMCHNRNIYKALLNVLFLGVLSYHVVTGDGDGPCIPMMFRLCHSPLFHQLCVEYTSLYDVIEALRLDTLDPLPDSVIVLGNPSVGSINDISSGDYATTSTSSSR